MPAFKITSGETVHCVELTSGKKLTGTLSLDHEGIRASIYSHEEGFFIRGEGSIVLLTEKNEIVSLHSILTNPPGNSSRMVEPTRTIYRQDIISNVAVSGHDEWQAIEKIKRVSFTVKHTDGLLNHQAKTRFLTKNRNPDKENLHLYSEPVGNKTVRAGYSVTYTSAFNAPTHIRPQYELEFSEGASLYDYIEHVSCYVQFLSFSLGFRLKPSEICISRHSRDEMMSLVEILSYPGDHNVNYVWPDVEIDAGDVWIGGSPVIAWDDNELSVLRQCVVFWIQRYSEWRNAYVLMMTSLSLKGEISPNRLIAACKWFEEIPLTKPLNAIAKEHINAIASAAGDKAMDLGYDSSITRRIYGSLKTIRTESHKDRFSRLVILLRQRFSYSILPKDVVFHLCQAIEFRGRTAHGHFQPLDEAESRAFSMSIYAMEAICFLLTALDLPIHEKGRQRVQHNPVIRDYRNAF